MQILYDLSAAFDTVMPKVIIEKLKVYGFDYMARRWMESYLTGRSQITMVGGKLSKAVDLCYGTPQGSRLSPLLFIILMADLDLWTTRQVTPKVLLSVMTRKISRFWQKKKLKQLLTISVQTIW